MQLLAVSVSALQDSLRAAGAAAISTQLPVMVMKEVGSSLTTAFSPKPNCLSRRTAAAVVMKGCFDE